MSDVQVYYAGNMARGMSSAEERDFGALANKVVLYADYAALESQHAALKEKADRMAVDAWMPIETALPSDNEPVLLTLENADGHRWVIRAFYAHRFTESIGLLDDAAEDGEYSEYSKEKDEYFLKPGWYEQNQYEETHWRVGDKAIAWKYMPLPAPPAKPIHKDEKGAV